MADVGIEVSNKTKNILKDMLQSEPDNRIELNEILDFVCDYELERKEERL